jgi:hypothetical protein
MNRRDHSGQTIVSLMVGLLISLIVVVSMLALYKILIDISGSASSVAARDGQVSSGFLAAESLLQDAGFGIAATELPGQRIVVNGTGNRTVIWVYRQTLGGSYYCGGLRLKLTAEDTRGAGLYTLIPVLCPTGVNDAAVVWSSTNSVPLTSTTAFYTDSAAGNEQGSYTLNNSYNFSSTNGTCWPYGQQAGTAVSHPQVSFNFQNDTLFTACLSNL